LGSLTLWKSQIFVVRSKIGVLQGKIRISRLK
jgi:hypothetical protein